MYSLFYSLVNFFKKLYIKTLLFFLGKAFVAGGKLIPEVKEELKNFEDDLLLTMTVMPNGPEMKLLFSGEKIRFAKKPPQISPETLTITIKYLEAAFVMFTFRESTSVAFARSRMTVNGDLGKSMAFVRCLNWVEFYLLPAIFARRALKRYPAHSVFKKAMTRVKLYSRLLFV
ncbi:MAG: hypothetical protein GXO77_14165 [Calditrichaeota bacterium]|nr:hypothetical protein [Calditrichota bacterium]